MSQAALWNQLIEPGITAIVGAGGKTTVLTKLVEYARLQGQPVMVSTTTKLYETQVISWNPYYTEDFHAAENHCRNYIQQGKAAAWFRGVEGTKVVALESAWLDHMSMVHPKWQILVEADGAKEKWIKAPKVSEPVIPKNTTTTIGVLNLQILGEIMDEKVVHNIDELLAVTGAKIGDKITPMMLTNLVRHPHGLFQYSKGRRILFCTGYDTVAKELVDKFLLSLAETMENTKVPLKYIVLADGYKASCEIIKLINWRSEVTVR